MCQRGGAADCIFEAVEAGDHGAPFGHGSIGRHEERERILHLAEGTDSAAHNHFAALQGDNGAWAITPNLVGIHCVALTESDLSALIEQYRAATRRAIAAGFDVLEIHAAHGYLLHSFLSPLSNNIVTAGVDACPIHAFTQIGICLHCPLTDIL